MVDVVSPESVGMSSARLARVSEWLEAQVSSQRLAGCGVMIGRRGKVAHFEAVGLSDVEAQRSFNRDSIARIFSMTKAVTTVAAMMLYERGCFQLDDPVTVYIPEFAQTPVWAGGETAIHSTVLVREPMTIRHLMTHTSGLTYGFMRANVVDEQYRQQKVEEPGADCTLETWIKRLAAVPLMCQPGSQWNYSVSSDVLGRLVEIWSGHTLADFFQHEIFEPLGMVDTGFHVEPKNHDRFTSLYSPATGGDMASVGSKEKRGGIEPGGLKLQDPAESSRYLEPTQHFSGGGGLTGTMADYGRFCQMLINRGELDGERLLGRKTVEYMQQNQLPDNKDMAAMGQPVWSETSYDGIGFGLGFAVVLDPIKAHIITSPGEYHWGGAASTFFWLDPTEDLYTVFFTQLIPSSTYPIRRELRTRVYQALID